MGYQLLDPEVAKKVASSLLEIEAIKLNTKKPFVWSSGLKSPIYCDNRYTLSYPEIRNYIKDNLLEIIRSYFPKVETIAGVATAGIPQGALIADSLGLPYNYVRAKSKGHGMENKIEGKVLKGKKVVLIEDLISTGGSSLAAADALKQAGYQVLGVAAIFTYGFSETDQVFDEKKVPLYCLSNYGYLIEMALEGNYIDEDQSKSLKSWRIDPKNWKNR